MTTEHDARVSPAAWILAIFWRCIVAKRTLTLIFLATFVLPIAGQSQPSIQGVWRFVELIVPASTAPTNGDVGGRAASRRDPFGAFPQGTHTSLQPGLAIFTGRYYSRTSDTAAQPRPTTGDKIPGQPTLEELQSRWGPFAANAGTYELLGSVLTLRAVVAKDPRAQSQQNFTRLTVKLDGNNLWLTPMENEAGKIPNPVTNKFVRVE
jgi:hypothetical protein